MASKKTPEIPPAGAPAWMATYGDLVTLLLCFFVLLYAMSDVNEIKLQQIAASFSGNPILITENSGSDGINEMLGNGIMEMPNIPKNVEKENKEKQEAQEQLAKMASEFKTYFAENDANEFIEVELNEDYIVLNFKDGILFDVGKSSIRQEALNILKAVAIELEINSENDIEILGHTDNDPINTIQFPNNWTLSASRAINVGLYFIEQGNIIPSRISAVGKGEYFPISPNDTPENKASNRRVEIFINSKYYSNG
jgi:chemotaxis protein MotB